MKYRLVHLTGGLAGRVRDVDTEEIVLGRDPQAAQVVFGADDRDWSAAATRAARAGRRFSSCATSTAAPAPSSTATTSRRRSSRTATCSRSGPWARACAWSWPKEERSSSIRGHGAGAPAGRSRGSRLRRARVVRRSRRRARRGSRQPPAPHVRERRAHGRLRRARGIGGAHRPRGRQRGLDFPRTASCPRSTPRSCRLDGAYVLIDLESTNGTFLNGHRIERSPLRHGDVVGARAGRARAQGRDPRPRARGRAGATVVIPHFEELAARRQEGVLVQEVTVGEGPLVAGRGEDVGAAPRFADREPRARAVHAAGRRPDRRGPGQHERHVRRGQARGSRDARGGRARGRGAVRPRRRGRGAPPAGAATRAIGPGSTRAGSAWMRTDTPS